MNTPAFLLRELYTTGSLSNANGGGAEFALENRHKDAEVIGVRAIAIDGEPLPLNNIPLEVDGRAGLRPGEIDAAWKTRLPTTAPYKTVPRSGNPNCR